MRGNDAAYARCPWPAPDAANTVATSPAGFSVDDEAKVRTITKSFHHESGHGNGWYGYSGPITSEFQNDTFVVTILGDFGPGELTEAIIAAYSDPRFMTSTPILVDTRRSLAIPSGADVVAASRTIQGRRPAGHTGRFAIVTRSEPLRFGLARMATLNMESLGATMAVFHETEAALKFLGSTGSSLSR